jgi:hypothetical protein
MDPHDQVEVGLIHVRERLVPQDACVVDEDVDTTPSLDGAPHHGIDRRRVGDVRSVGDGLTSRVLDLFHHGLGCGEGRTGSVPGASEVVHHDPSPSLGEGEGVGSTESVTGTGDDRHLFIECDHDKCSWDDRAAL